jgi:hypothetical protein
MIVKGIIKTINFLENSCTVRLPLFETAAADGEVILDAIISIQPGLYNGYTEGDVVFVDFENNKLSQPIVVGKLFLGAEKEAAAGAPSAMTVSNLKVTTQATLPVDTRLSLEGLGNIVPVEKGISSYHSLVDIIKALHQTETSVQQTIKDQSGTVSNIIVEYLSQPVEQEAPTAENTGWNITSPDYKDGFEIWQKTTCYNHRGQALSTEIICLSSIASAVIYKVRCSTRVHAGTNQTEAVKISAWVKLGTELETLDTSANICYCWSDGKGSELTDWTESGTYEVTLEPAQLRAQNLVIQVKHGSEVYEEETIMYAPLNTPVLHLSNEADVLLYAANGTDCLATAGVSSTATLYVNGDPLEATYVWEWDPRLCTCEHAVDESGQQLQNTIIVTAVNSTSAPGVVTCKATVTLDGPFKGKVYSKDFTVTQIKIGTSIISQETYYALIHSRHSAGAIKTPPKTGDLIVRDTDGNQLNTINESQLEEWSLTPPEHTPNTNGWKYWTTVKTTYSTSLDDFEFSPPIINEDLSGVYSLAQGKTTNYYGNFEPTRNPEPSATQVYKPNLRVDDCWFDTTYKEISAAELATLDFASKYINYYVGEGSTKTLVTSSNYTTLSITPKTTKAYKKGALKQCIAIAANGTATWEDISDEMVTNKLTATYINALDITAKKIKILNDEGNTTLFEADGLSNNHTVKIAGFEVSTNGLYTSGFGTSYSEAGKTNSGVYVGKDGIQLGKNFYVDNTGAVVASSLKISSTKTIETALSETQAAAEATAQTNLENALKDPTTAGGTTLGSDWLSTTNVVAQNLTAGKIEVKNGTNTVLYANANDANNTLVGGFKIGTTTFKSADGKVGISSDNTSGTYSFWAGHATPASAPFSVTPAGAVKATDLTIKNMTASGTSGVTINGGKFTVKTKGDSPTTLFEVDSSLSKTTLSGNIHNVGNIFSGCEVKTVSGKETLVPIAGATGNIYTGGIVQSIGGIWNQNVLVNTGLITSYGGIENLGVLTSSGLIYSDNAILSQGALVAADDIYFKSTISVDSDGEISVTGYSPVIQLAPNNSNCMYTTMVTIATYTKGTGINQGAYWKTVTLPSGLYGYGNSRVKGAYVTGYLSSKNNLTVTNVTEGSCGKTSTSTTEVMNMGTQGYTPYVSWDNNNLYVLLPPIKVDSNVSPGFTIKMCVLIVGAI